MTDSLSAVLSFRTRRRKGSSIWLKSISLALPWLSLAPGAVAANSPFQQVTFAELSAVSPGSLKQTDPESISPAAAQLNGRRVRLMGYMLALSVEGGRTRDFLIMRNQSACCFGKMPAATEYVVARVPSPGVPVTADVPVTFQGTLRVSPVYAGGELVEFYALDNAKSVAP